MKKHILIIITALVVAFNTNLFANSIDVITNQSAKYTINSARYGTTDNSADAAYYNPAGTAFMNEGIYFDLSSQTLILPYKQDVAVPATGLNESYSQGNIIPILPNLFIVDNLGRQGIGNLALFCNAGVVGGGGLLEWNGTAGTVAAGFNMGSLMGPGVVPTKIDMDFNASVAIYQAGAGAAYSVTDYLSFSAGVRYVIARKSIEMKGNYLFSNTASLNMDYETELSADGYTFIAGLDVKPVKYLNIGVKYEAETALRYEYDNKTNNASDNIGDALASGVRGQNALADGTKVDAGLPAILAIGVEYTITDKWIASASSLFYFMSKVDMDGVEDYFETGYDLSIGTTYSIMDDLKLGCTLTYTSTGAKDSYFKADSQILTVSANPPLDSVIIGGGATYNLTQNTDITGSFTWSHYLPKDVTTSGGIDVKYEKEAYIIALGAGHKM